MMESVMESTEGFPTSSGRCPGSVSSLWLNFAGGGVEIEGVAVVVVLSVPSLARVATGCKGLAEGINEDVVGSGVEEGAEMIDGSGVEEGAGMTDGSGVEGGVGEIVEGTIGGTV